MPNSLTVKVIEDGPRNAIVNIVGTVDANDVVATPVVSLGQFTGNGRGSFVGFKVVDVDYAVTDGLVVNLAWDSNTPQPIAALSGSSKLCGKEHGGLRPDRLAGGYDGNINLSTDGFTAGRRYGFTLRMSMTKLYA